MLTPDRLFRLINEMLFLLLGALLAWVGASGRIFFNRHSLPWVVVSVALILWGVRALAKPGAYRARWENWTRGASLVLTGALMVAIARVPFAWVGPLLIAAGGLLILRGILGTALVLRLR
ncbi:MAG: hypothetical protein LAN84_03130 [Acidobacteriia bacterium]|nr:hypothetical protein [Terriglobia bacterium]